MKKLGGALGIELDSQCAKHFFLLGLQASMSTLSTAQSAQMLSVFQSFAQAVQSESVEQMDLVKEADRKSA